MPKDLRMAVSRTLSSPAAYFLVVSSLHGQALAAFRAGDPVDAASPPDPIRGIPSIPSTAG